MDAFAIPEEACVVRMNDVHDANECMINYSEVMKNVNREEGIRGWHHSNPGN